MTDLVTVTGFVGSDPRHNVTAAGLSITNFRLATTRRYFDRAKGEWVDGETNWYSVAAFRQLAVNAAASISKGDRVVVQGRLRVRPWETGEKSGTAVEIDADAIGHDLSWGRTEFTRTAATRSEAEDRAEEAGAAGAPATTEDAWALPGSGSGWPEGGATAAAAPAEEAELRPDEEEATVAL